MKVCCLLALKRLAMAVAGLIAIPSVVYLLTPVPGSPPLRDARGIELDTESEAKLIQVVFESARQNDVPTVAEYLKRGFTPNVRNQRGDTLLTVAVYHGSSDVVEELLAHPDIDTEARNRMGLTAVSTAVFRGHERPLRALLAAGADVHSTPGMYQTAILLATLFGRDETVEVLLAAYAEPTASSRSASSAALPIPSPGTHPSDELLEVRAE